MRSTPCLLRFVLLLGLVASPAAADQVCGQLLPIGLLEPAGGFTLGCSRQFTLKLSAALGPDGNYILLDMPPCPDGPCAGLSGGAQLQCAAASGYACCIQTGLHVPTLTGGNVGALAAGLGQRFALDSDPSPGICYASYAGNGARVALASLAEFPGGIRTEMVVTSFARVFLVAPPAGSGQATTFTVEFLAQGPTAARSLSWGRIKQLYR